MKNLKKLVSVIVTVAMLISSFAALSVSAAYGNYPDVEQDSSFYKAIKVLSGLGIVKGDDEGNFNPSSDIKRSEMVALVCRMLGEEDVALAAGGSSFDDVAANHWAAGYIAWGVSSNIVNGVGDNKFDPDASVKYQDAVVMVLRALGYDRIAQRPENGGYPTGYLKVASQRGVLAGASFDAAKAATREVVAQVIYNAMTTPIVDISYYAANPEDDEYTVYDGKNGTDLRTLLTWTNEIYKVKATVENTAKTDEALRKDIDAPKAELKMVSAYDYAWDEVLDGDYKKNSKAVVYAGETEVADYLGYTVEAYIVENDDEEWELLSIVVDSKSTDTETISDNFESYNATTGVFEYYVDDDASRTTKIDVNVDELQVYYNGSLIEDSDIVKAFGDLETLLVDYANEITFMGPKNDDYTKIFVTDYDYRQVDTVKADDLYVKFTYGGLTLDADERGNDSFIYNLMDAEGNAITLADVKEDDIFNIVAPMVNGKIDVLSDDVPYMDIYVTDTAVEGSVTEEVIAGEKYEISDVEYKVTSHADIEVGDEGIFYITIDGLVYDSDAAAVANKNYSFIVAYGNESDFGVKTHQLKLFTAEGTLETYDVAANVKVYEGDVAKNYKRSNGAQDKFFAGEPFASVAAGYTTEANAVAGLASRVVTYRTNSSNEITEIRFAATSNADFIVDKNFGAGYKADTEVFGRYDLDSNSVLFVAPVSEIAGAWNVDEDDLEIASFDSLDEDKADGYDAYMFKFERDDYLGAAIVGEEIDGTLKKSHLAVVKKRAKGLDAEGLDVTKYTIVQSGETTTLAVDYDKMGEVEEMSTGDVFRFTKNGEGEIKSTNLIYDASAETFDAGAYEYADYDDNDIAIVYGKATLIKSNALTIDTTPAVDDGTENDLRFKLNDVEENTYVMIDEARLTSSNPSAAVKVLSSAASIKESYGSNEYYVVAIIGETSRFEDVVEIEKN